MNVTYKPKTQGWAIYISYKHEIVYIVIWHVTEIKILLTYTLDLISVNPCFMTSYNVLCYKMYNRPIPWIMYKF